MPPMPKHPSQRHGHRTKAEQAHDEIERTGALVWPEPSQEWAELARDWYLSLAQSAQAIDYTSSDVQTARVLATALSRSLHRAGPISSNTLAVFMSGAGDLLATAGSRRRLKLEIRRESNVAAAAHDAAVASLRPRNVA